MSDERFVEHRFFDHFELFDGCTIEESEKFGHRIDRGSEILNEQNDLIGCQIDECWDRPLDRRGVVRNWVETSNQ